MHLAQCIVTHPANIGHLGQGCVIEPPGHKSQPPQQGLALPLQRLLMTVAPGTGIVVPEFWLIRLVVRRVPDSPFVERLIRGQFIKLLIHLHIEPALHLILPQGVGLELSR